MPKREMSEEQLARLRSPENLKRLAEMREKAKARKAEMGQVTKTKKEIAEDKRKQELQEVEEYKKKKAAEVQNEKVEPQEQPVEPEVQEKPAEPVEAPKKRAPPKPKPTAAPQAETGKGAEYYKWKQVFKPHYKAKYGKQPREAPVRQEERPPAWYQQVSRAVDSDIADEYIQSLVRQNQSF